MANFKFQLEFATFSKFSSKKTSRFSSKIFRKLLKGILFLIDLYIPYTECCLLKYKAVLQIIFHGIRILIFMDSIYIQY